MLVYKKNNFYKNEYFQNDRLFKKYQKDIFTCTNKQCINDKTQNCLKYCVDYKLNKLCPHICIKNNKYMNDNINWNSYMLGEQYTDFPENR